jgi:hypothetical protein
MNPDPKDEMTEAEKDWLDLAKRSPWVFSNYGDKRDMDEDDDCSETSFQKFCDHSGNNRYPTQ